MLNVHVELWTCVSLYKYQSFAFTVDGDPHFIISVPQKEDAICFNINENPGAVLNLINDPVTGEFYIFLNTVNQDAYNKMSYV